jgi:hypothetical protein
MKRNGISIRKVFDGSKEEQNPAGFFIVREPTGKDAEFSLIDIAVKLRDWQSHSLIVSPVADYHRSTNSNKPQNKAGASLKVEFRPFGMTMPVDSVAFGPNRTRHSLTGKFVPTFGFDAKASHDWIADYDEFVLRAVVYPTSNLRWGPGTVLRGKGGVARGRYYPYLGIERWDFRGNDGDTTAVVGLARLWAEFWPVATEQREYLQITIDVAGRRRLTGADNLKRDMADVTLGANLYLDGNGHFGIGVDHAQGRDASNRFARRQKTTFGVKLKF